VLQVGSCVFLYSLRQFSLARKVVVRALYRRRNCCFSFFAALAGKVVAGAPVFIFILFKLFLWAAYV